MRRLLPALLALAFAIPPVAAAEDLPGYYGGGTGGSIRIHSIALTDRQPAGVYTFGTAFPIASMDFNRGSAFSGVLYACDTNDPDTDGDNDLADESGCQSLATLSADTANGAMRARKLVYALDINTAETAGNTSRLTIKGSFDQVSAGSTAPILASDYGVAPGVQSNQASAANEAIAAAAAAGGGTVLLPDGIIHLGNTGAGGFYSGIQITQSNITLKCETDLGCELRPLFTHGGTLIAACPAFNNSSTYGGDKNCTSGAHLTNVHISGIKFHDDNPTNHCQSYSAASGACSSEETHGIFMSDCDNCSMVGNWVSDIGDEGFVYNDSSGGVIADNLATGTPSIRSALGNAIEISGMTGGVIRDNVVRDILADPNSDGGSCTDQCWNNGKGITLGTSSGANEDILVSGNMLIDLDNAIGISISSSGNHNSTISVVDNHIEMDNIGVYRCWDNVDTPTVPRQCSIALTGSTSNQRSDILIQGNITNAGVLTIPTSGFGPISWVDNQIDGGTPTPGRGMTVGGNPLLVEGNHIRGFRDEGIYVIGLTTDDRTESVLITNNTLLDIGCADLYDNPAAGGGAQSDDGSAAADLHWDYDGEDIHDVITGFNTCGSDGKIIGGVTVTGNKIIGGGSALFFDEAISFNTCVRASVMDNYIDYNGSIMASGQFGISHWAHADANTVIGATQYGLYTSVDGAIATGNYVEGPTSRGILATSSAADFVAIGNTIVADATRAIESQGQRPICVHNISRSTSGSDRLFECGEGGSDASCDADTAADGICAENQVCNTGDTDCS